MRLVLLSIRFSFKVPSNLLPTRLRCSGLCLYTKGRTSTPPYKVQPRKNVPHLSTLLRAADRCTWKWLWKHCLLSFYLRNEQVLIDTRKYDRRIVLPISSFSWSCPESIMVSPISI